MENLFYFSQWTIKELNQSASVQLLDKLAPAINHSHLIDIARLVEGNPLALKVVGRLLHSQGDKLANKIKEGLLHNPLNVLDEASFQKERFHTKLDVAFARVGELKECGYILGLFTGWFKKDLGAVVSRDCLKLYKKYSLLEEYYIAHHYRYKMHKLIRDYVKEKLKDTSEIIIRTFKIIFKEYYERFLFEYAV